jgi:Domain of unknown function (DUF4178)
MSPPAANCPNCGAAVQFRWSSSVQTVCAYCQSILVRTDLDLQKVGTVADLPRDGSPIQIGTEGRYRHLSFVTIGRIIYEYDQGTWNEWHLAMSDGKNGWLSDAQFEYAVTFAAPRHQMPAAGAATVNARYEWDGVQYTVTTITDARYRGIQGELPFQTWDKEKARFVDLRSAAANCATLDYSDADPVLYLGEIVDGDALQLKNLRSFEGWPS